MLDVQAFQFASEELQNDDDVMAVALARPLLHPDTSPIKPTFVLCLCKGVPVPGVVLFIFWFKYII